MYKTQVEQKVYVQHTFINDDCVYETTKYIMNEDKSFVDHGKCGETSLVLIQLVIFIFYHLVNVLKNPDEFSIHKTLSFVVGGEFQML